MSLNSRDQSSNQKVMLAYLNDLLNREHGGSSDTKAPLNSTKTAEANTLPPVLLSPSILDEVVPDEISIDDDPIEKDLDQISQQESVQSVDQTVLLDDLEEEPTEYLASEWLENGRPAWAQDAFDILLFKVNGMSLAVPLITLGQIYEITDALRPLFGQAPWFLGIQPTPMGKIKVVNTARYVMPERYDENSAQQPEYIMTIDQLQWGLTVNSVDQPIRIPVDGVKWRRERQQQPWMAGIVKDHMCVLIDVPTLGRALLDSDISK